MGEGDVLLSTSFFDCDLRMAISLTLEYLAPENLIAHATLDGDWLVSKSCTD